MESLSIYFKKYHYIFFHYFLFFINISISGEQLLLVQDGKLCGRDFFYDVISRALALPELAKDQEFQKNEFVVQLGQVRVLFVLILLLFHS